MSTLQHWFALTFAHLAQAFAWPIWGLVAGGVILVVAGIGLIVYCYVKALEASD